jgi:hypothetical protein
MTWGFSWLLSFVNAFWTVFIDLIKWTIDGGLYVLKAFITGLHGNGEFCKPRGCDCVGLDRATSASVLVHRAMWASCGFGGDILGHDN